MKKAKTGTAAGKVEIYCARDLWRWRLIAANGKVMAESPQGYAKRHRARDSAFAMRATVMLATLVEPAS